MSFGELFDRALPQLMQKPKAQQYAIQEALQHMIAAKKLECEALHMMNRAISGTYTWWMVTGSAVPKRAWSPDPVNARVAGCGNLDAVMRARRVHGFKYIFQVEPCPTTPYDDGDTHG